MDRYVLTDAQWAKMQLHCRGKKSDPGRSGEDNRRFVDRANRQPVARPSSRVRPLEQRLQTVSRLGERRCFQRLFDAASEEPDMEYAMVDATIVKVHRHGQGAKGGLRARP